MKKIWIGLLMLVVLSPLGLVLPEYFKTGAAWGEWSGNQIQEFVGYIPRGLAKLAGLCNAPMPGYVFKGWEEKGLLQQSFAYIFSGFIGLSLVVLIVIIIGKFLAKKE